MDRVEFNKTSNIFINTGIVALHRWIKRFQLHHNSFGGIRNELFANKLVVENEKLYDLLEEVYYFMGKEVYDTASLKQIQSLENAYYKEDTEEFIRFPKMNTYGLTALLTNNAQGNTRIKENSIKMIELEIIKPELANKIKNYFTTNGLILLSKIYLNEPYTKITRLKIEKKYWDGGNQFCPLTGEYFKMLVEGQNISPFLSGISNFNTQLESCERKVSQKALFVIRFSPALAMYSYYKGYDTFISTFFNSNNLISMNSLYSDEFFYIKDEMELQQPPFQRNIKLINFRNSKKNDEEYSKDTRIDCYSPQEITFLLLYTFYKKKLQLDIDDTFSKEELDPFDGSLFEKVPISLVAFKAETFAKTMRPNFYEEYNNVKFIIRLIHRLETNETKRIPIEEIWRGLIFKSQKTTSLNDNTKRQMLERKPRAEILLKVLKGKSILNEIASFYSKCFTTLSNGDDCGYRRYDLITSFLIIYETATNFEGIDMDKTLQQRAINLGKSIGQGIINYDNPKNDTEKKANAKNGRKYLISMNKARSISQFREVLIRIQRKYSIAIANDIIENLSESNYLAIKQYAQIGALNTLNIILSNQKPE